MKSRVSLPHARGGVSVKEVSGEIRGMSSPRTWGCFQTRCFYAPMYIVFPTHVGVFLHSFITSMCLRSLPHARGGVSRGGHGNARGSGSSPRTWGCFHIRVLCLRVLRRLPHARGGVSRFRRNSGFSVGSSPRTWGCFIPYVKLFERLEGLPHARGGVS